MVVIAFVHLKNGYLEQVVQFVDALDDVVVTLNDDDVVAEDDAWQADDIYEKM